jgi:hypothetical protein
MALELLRIDPATSENPATLADPTYYGYATPGTQDTEAKWSIKKRIIASGATYYQYPYISGTTSINSYPAIDMANVYYIQPSGLVWTLRSGYTYR